MSHDQIYTLIEKKKKNLFKRTALENENMGQVNFKKFLKFNTSCVMTKNQDHEFGCFSVISTHES